MSAAESRPAGVPRSALDSARLIAPRAGELAASIERERALPGELVSELREAGLMHMCLPASLGGREAAPRELMLALEALARGDGATGWCAMIASTSGLLGAYLPAEEAALVYDGARNVVGGVFAPRGRATRASDGSYLVEGRWPFVSGVGHCAWVMGGCLVERDAGDGPELLESGTPDIRLMLMPRADVEVIDTWSVAGLCGTGSHDVQAAGVTVRHALGVSLFTDAPVHQGALYSFPLFGLLALGICSVALGIARGAVEELSELAGEKRGARSLAERATIQAEVAKADAKTRSARAFVLEQADEAWDAVQSGAPLSREHRLGLRLAATHATWAAAEAVGAMYHAGGGSAIYTDSPLQRRFRDVNVAAQHIMVAPATWELAGRLLLGLPADTSQL